MGSSQILLTILFLCRKNASAGTIFEDLVICYLTKHLLNDINEIEVTIKKWRLLFTTAKMLLDFNGYNIFTWTTAVPRMLRGTRHVFHISLFVNTFYKYGE